LAEDEDATRTALRDILASLGYDVVAVGSGEEAQLLPKEVQAVLND
jgi:CheY-like chemotaxis protein